MRWTWMSLIVVILAGCRHPDNVSVNVYTPAISIQVEVQYEIQDSRGLCQMAGD